MSATAFDRHDRALLASCNEATFQFMNTSAKEARAFRLFKIGLMDRKSKTWRANQSTVEIRWAYRLTDAGRAALGEDGGGDGH